MTIEERKRKFQFFQDANLDIDDGISLRFWKLSKGSKVYGQGSGEARNTYMCRRCGSIVGDMTTHSQWHSWVEQVKVEETKVSASYQ